MFSQNKLIVSCHLPHNTKLCVASCVYKMWGLLSLWDFKEVHVAKCRKYKGDVVFTNIVAISVPNTCRLPNLGFCTWNYPNKARNMNVN